MERHSSLIPKATSHAAFWFWRPVKIFCLRIKRSEFTERPSSGRIIVLINKRFGNFSSATDGGSLVRSCANSKSLNTINCTIILQLSGGVDW